MRKVLLIFPDVTSLADFVLTHRLSKVITDSAAKTLQGTIHENYVEIACRQFGAKIKESVAVKHFTR